MIATNMVRKISEGEPNILTLLDSGKVDYVVSTSGSGKQHSFEGLQIRRKTVERSIPCLTSLDTANALARCLKMYVKASDLEMVDVNMI
ncbi:Carbamoyl-phosphate synthase large chain [bioreactor metagenome]|uniref:Carbamoyl-phosphate synthase large chain n=1 Tax=bioreactor metagenome TaxID=1076179 RepID=A0A645FQR7_9ZZZZ